MQKKHLLVILIVLCLLIYAAFKYIDRTNPLNSNNAAALSSVNKALYADITRGTENTVPSTVLDPMPSSESLSIGWVGDIVPIVANGSGNFVEALTPFFSSLDIMSGNLEGVVSDSSEYQSKCVKMGRDNCFAIKGTSDFAQILKQGGFDVMNIANNHSFDFGSLGFADTQKALDSVGLMHTGAKGKIAYVTTQKGVVAFVGFAQNYQLNSMLIDTQITGMIAEARAHADIVVAIVHAGGEGISNLTVPDGNEVYLGDNRGNTKEIARMMIDSGADLVLGSGPHVLRGMEMYKGKLIAYSLGNFYASNKLSSQNFLGISGILVVNIDSNKNIKSLKVIPMRISPADGIPRLDQSGAAIKLMNHLSQENFGGNGVLLGEDGVYVVR